MAIIEDMTGYIPLEFMGAREVSQSHVISIVKLSPDPLDSFGISMRKQYGTHKKKGPTTQVLEYVEATVEIYLPNDIPPKPLDAPNRKLTKMKSIHW